MKAGWMIATIAIGIIALVLGGLLIYATFFKPDTPTESGYITVLESDYDGLITRVGDLEASDAESLRRISDVEQISAEATREFEISRAEVARLTEERDHARRIVADLGSIIGESINTTDSIAGHSSRAEEELRRAINIYERSQGGNPEDEE